MSRWLIIKKEIRYLSFDEIVEIHEEVIQESGGVGGILSEGDIDFISDFLKNDIDVEAKDDLFKGAAKLVYWIISGHPFIDGNKRTGIECADIFLRKNEYYLEVDVKEGVRFGLRVAMDKMDLMDIRRWLKRNVRKD